MSSMRYVRYLNFFVFAGLPTAYAVHKNQNSTNVRDELRIKVGKKPVPLPSRLQTLVDEVLNDMNLTEEEKRKVQPFMCKERDMTHVSSSLIDWEAYLGIPQYFLLDTNDNDFYMELVVEVEGKEFPKNQPEYKSLKDSLTLSNEAKKFAIAQEIFLLQRFEAIHYILVPLVFALKSNIISLLIDKSALRNRRRSPAWTHLMILFNSYILYALLLCFFNNYEEKESLNKAAQLGASYVNGGLEFYQKMLKRNKMIKKFNEKAPFGENGDVTSSIISYCLPFAKRLEYLREFSFADQRKKFQNL